MQCTSHGNRAVVATAMAGLGILMLASAAGAAESTVRSDYAAGSQPTDVAAGDFDGDGDADLAVTDNGSNQVSILFNDGAGGFGTRVSLALPAGLSEPNAIVAGDVDGDGDVDLAVAIGYAGYMSSVVVVMQNAGDGSFAQASYACGYDPVGVAMGDIDGNGAPDILTANYYDDSITKLFNDGTGQFETSTTTPSRNYIRNIELCDVDNDGDLDLALTWLHGMMVLINDGSGAWASGTAYAPGIRPTGIAFGDLDADGDADLVITDPPGGRAYVLTNMGTGVYSTAGSYLTGAGPMGVGCADLDQDGNVDMAITCQSVATVEVRLNDGSGGFGTPEVLHTGSTPVALVIADFNGDGALDLATANNGSNSVTVLLRPGCRVDVNGDGTLDFFDVSMFLDAFAGHEASADVNGDDVFDFFDVSTFLGWFSAGCP